MISFGDTSDCYLGHLFLYGMVSVLLFIMHQSSICHAPPLHSSLLYHSRRLTCIGGSVLLLVAVYHSPILTY